MPEIDVRSQHTVALAALLEGHVALKGAEAGALLGAVAGPLVALARGTGAPAQDSVLVGAAYGAAGGTALSALLGLGKIATLDRSGLEDRVYRLCHNESQRRVDTFSVAGGALGAAAAYALVKAGGSGGSACPVKPSSDVPLRVAVAGGAAVGSALGVLAHMATRPGGMGGPNKMLDEFKSWAK
jgi:hypothetical protein